MDADSRTSARNGPPSDQARVALVGYGSSGRGIHLPLLRAAGTPPAVVVTANAERREQAADDLPSARIAPDLASALAERPDLVVLASPSGVHHEQALACVASGVPVVVDKPLAVDAGQARAVVDAAAHAGVPLTVFQNRRWDAENRTLARLLHEGVLGDVHRFERRWERWRPTPKQRWRENAPAGDGGGILLDLQTHLVDAAVWLFGPVTSVYAELSAWTTPAEDEAFLAVRHVSGVVSHLGASSVAGAPGPRTRVLGSAGSYVVTVFESEQAAFAGFDDVPGCCGWFVAGEHRTPVTATGGAHEDFYTEVLDALGHTEPTARQAAMPVHPQDAVHVLEVLDGARKSAATGTVVHLSH